ncbi:hypothetical protein Adt_12129 [Abeliophyllum distichum]|uniref:Uncharacterized protein n=1 Tax=Abeliophyllum distichum TaxID=126358 RepID=A0ABD1URA3_9LAMI
MSSRAEVESCLTLGSCSKLFFLSWHYAERKPKFENLVGLPFFFKALCRVEAQTEDDSFTETFLQFSRPELLYLYEIDYLTELAKILPMPHVVHELRKAERGERH